MARATATRRAMLASRCALSTVSWIRAVICTAVKEARLHVLLVLSALWAYAGHQAPAVRVGPHLDPGVWPRHIEPVLPDRGREVSVRRAPHVPPEPLFLASPRPVLRPRRQQTAEPDARQGNQPAQPDPHCSYMPPDWPWVAGLPLCA